MIGVLNMQISIKLRKFIFKRFDGTKGYRIEIAKFGLLALPINSIFVPLNKQLLCALCLKKT